MGILQAIIGSTVGITGLAIVYCTIERLWPAIPGQRRLRGGIRIDLGFFYLNTFVSKFGTGVLASIVVLALGWSLGLSIGLDTITGAAPRETIITALPVPLQLLVFFVLADLSGYWTHRAFHRRPLLWRFHSIHHSSVTLDWLSGTRVHPVNDIAQNAAPAIPLLLLGFNPATFAVFLTVLTLVSVIVHANVGWTWGPLRYAIISPVYHRWHHTTEDEGIDRNFAGLFPWLDLLFGTFYMPKGVQPTRFGIAGAAPPQAFVGQLLYPIRGRPRSAQT